MKTLYIMSGIPGSGKSYWATNHVEKLNGRVAYVSRDEIRFSLISDKDKYFSKEKEVFNTYVATIKEKLKEYDAVIADATQINTKSRTKLLRALGMDIRNVKIVAMVIETDLETALERNGRRDKKTRVPVQAIEDMFMKKNLPTLKEGFHEVWIYKDGKYNLHKNI